MSRLSYARTAAALLWVSGFFAGFAQAAPGAHGPNGEHLDGPSGTSRASSLMRLPDGSVNAPKLAQRRMGIRTQLAPVTAAAASVQLPGQVVVDPNAGGRVQAVHGGRIEPGPKGLPVAGEAVRKGQVLAYLRHHAEPFAEANQRSEASELRASRITAEQRVKRLESLEGSVPTKDIEAARTELASLRQRESTVGGSIRSRETLVSPVSGVIAQANALNGQVVDAKDLLFDIIDPQRLMIEATTADASLAAKIASATLAGVEGVTLRVVGAARTLRDGRIPITFRAQAKGTQNLGLAVGQSVTVLAQTKEQVQGVVLPAEALVRNSANETVVYIKVGAERYLPQPVTVQPLDPKTVLVTQGLAADNRVVVQGASLLNQIR
ncbi:MAG: efflux RND transporter periplasmic adaptor subunit [Rhizobacter sp.]|nr:efflux RND transporter periplasmic adaptor subunit [Rhizobacter sp.]